MLVLVAQSLSNFVITAAGTPHVYNGVVEYDISKVPFSRYG
ncbi:MAG: hypothetical protein ACLQVM_21270 [Terriglobia bacterium]